MQAAKSAAASAKETAANMAASAKAGMDKTKAVVQEKVEKMSAHDPTQKDIATHKKEERIHQAEQHKHEAREQNAAARHVASGDGNQHVSIAGARGPGHLPGVHSPNDGTGGHLSGRQGLNTGGFTTPDYLTGSDISESGPIPAHDANVEYPNTGTGVNLAHSTNIGTGPTTGNNDAV